MKIVVLLCLLGLVALVLSDNAERGFCPNNCSGHGTCSGVTCTCNNGYVGIDCSIASTNVTAGQTVTQRLSDHTWAYYVLNVPAGSSLAAFQMHQTSSGDCDLFVKYGSYPTRVSYDKYDISRDADFEIDFSSPNAGPYYAGVYGFYSCQYQLTFVINGANSCPGNCNGHGTCVAGTCNCNANYLGDDCSQEMVTAVLDQTYQSSVAEESWVWFKFVTIADGSGHVPATQFIVNQTSAGDCDMYISYNTMPTLFDFDYRDATFRSNFAITIGEPQVGVYYIGLYGYLPTSFSFRVHQLAPSCPNKCSLHGTCQGSTCSCQSGFSGVQCETMTTALPLDKSYEGYAGDNSWNYYHITPNSADNLVVEIVQTSADGDCDVYIKSGSNPTRFDFDMRDISYDSNFNVTIENPQLQTWYIGVYGYFGCSYNITAVVERSACPNACSHHGSCSRAGRCDCDAGFAGEDCSSPLYHLSNGIPRQTNITLNQWNYYKFEVPSVPSSLTVEVAEFNTVGLLWVYVNQGAPPTLLDFQQSDNSTSHFHTIYLKTHGDAQDVNYYIGVYGSPLVPVGANNAVDYGIIVYSPPI